MATTEIAGGTLGELNFAAAAAVGFLNPIGAQIDAFIGASLGPLQADLALQLNGSLSAAASISIGISDPTVGLRLALGAIAQLQAALSAALTLPTVSVSANASLSATLAVAAALEVKLGLLDIAISGLLRVKIPAVQLAAEAAASLSAGPAILLEFSGSDLATTGGELNSLFSSGVSFGGDTIAPGDDALGYVFVTKVPAAKAGLDFVVQGI